MFKLDLEKAKEPEAKLPTSVGSQKKQESSRKTSTSAFFITPKPLCRSQQTGKFFKRILGILDCIPCLLRNLHTGQEATESDVEQQTGSKLGKEYVKAG